MESTVGENTVGTGKRRIRADAQHNEDLVLEAAKDVFITSGVDAPVREIASKAGVGIATLYRRFPKRSDLIAAVFRREVDACVQQAAALAAEHDPEEALLLWLRRFTRFLAAKKGLATALHSGDSAYDTLPGYFRSNFEPALTALLDAGTASNAIRAEVQPYDLLRAISYLGMASAEPDGQEFIERMLKLVVNGLRVPDA